LAACDLSRSVRLWFRNLLGGVAYSEWGVVAVAMGATAAVVAPALAILFTARPTRAVLEPAG